LLSILASFLFANIPLSNNTTLYVADDNTPYAQVLQEITDDKVVVSYTYGNDLTSDNTHYFLTDALGSTRGLVDSDEELTDSYDYKPYGELLAHNGTSDNAFLFTGEQFDSETSNYYLRARYYNVGLGRFISRDTYNGTASNPITQNHYLYANSNPVLYVDPSGYVGVIELQLNINIQGELKNVNQKMLTKATKEVAKKLGCTIVIKYVDDMLTEAAGIYMFRASSNLPYVGRTNNFLNRFRAHFGKRLADLNHILGRLEFRGMGKELTQKELNLIEELLIREIDDMTGGKLIGMDNERYNYGPGMRDASHGYSDSKAFKKLNDYLQERCQGKR